MTSRKTIAPLAIVLCLCLSAFYSDAQDKAKKTLGKLTPSDFSLPATPIIDSSTTAVILADRGEAWYIGNTTTGWSVVWRRERRVKIVKKAGLGAASVALMLYSPKDKDAVKMDETKRKDDRLTDIEGMTTILENGRLTQIKLDPKDVYTTRIDKKYVQVRFSLPGVKEGAIADYSYTITSDRFWDLRSWEFQSENYPCLVSEFHVAIPQTFSFVSVRQGVHTFAVDKGKTGVETYRLEGDIANTPSVNQDVYVTTNTVDHDWVMKDIPAFGKEPYIATPDNYLDKLDFQLSSIYNGRQSFNYTNTWAKATEELLEMDDFGQILQQRSVQVEDLADKVPTEGLNGLATAKAVYYYVSSHFTCTDHYNPYVTTDLQDVIRKNSGTVGDVNFLLIAMLRRKGLDVEPVMLSTRNVGFNPAAYPIMDRLNYVLVRLKLEGKVYYLDAARPQLGFDQLPAYCYNGHARIISDRDSGSVYFEADSLKESSTNIVQISATDKGFEGTCQSTPGMEGSYEVRNDITEKGQTQYFKDIQTRFGEYMTISNVGIDSLKKLEDPVKIHYDFVLNQTPGASVLYFDPLLGEGWESNPLAAAERKYPVEMRYTMDETYLYTLEIPQGYAVDEMPKSTRVGFNGDQGQFEYLIAQQDGKIMMKCRFRLNKAWFPASDYANLRDFFAFVVKKEDERIVLKKL